MIARTLFALAVAGSLLVGCSKEEKPADTTNGSLGDSLKEAAGDAGKAVEDGADAVKDAAEGAAKEAEGDLAAQAEVLKAKAVAEAEDRLTALEATLQGLQTKVDAAAAPIKAIAQPLLDSAHQKHAAISPKIDALKAAGVDTWEAAGTELASVVDAFEQALDEVASKLGG